MQYLQRKGVRDAAVKEKRRRLGMDGELGSDEEEAQAWSGDEGQQQQEEEEEEEQGGLLVSLDEERAGVAKSAAAVAAQWFKQVGGWTACRPKVVRLAKVNV